MSDNEAPVEDEADQVSAFMSLPEVLQRAALMVIFAARDLPKDETTGLQGVFRELAGVLNLPDADDFLRMCGHVLTAMEIARFNGQMPTA